MKALFILLFSISLFNQSVYSLTSSEYYHNAIGVDEDINDDEDLRPKLRLGFTAPNMLHRQLLLTVDENATEGIDWGYEGEYYETDWDDMYWLLEGQKFTIIGTNIIDETIVLPLGFHTNTNGDNIIKLDGLENFYEDLGIYIHDKELDKYHSLRERDYHFYADAGAYLDRFELVFSLPQQVLSDPENEFTTFDFFYSNANRNIVVKNPLNKKINHISLYNMTGQIVYNINSINTFGDQTHTVPNLSTGTYIIALNTEAGMMTKKVLIK